MDGLKFDEPKNETNEPKPQSSTNGDFEDFEDFSEDISEPQNGTEKHEAYNVPPADNNRIRNTVVNTRRHPAPASKSKRTDLLQPPSMQQVDKDVFAALPPELQQEVRDSFKIDPAQMVVKVIKNKKRKGPNKSIAQASKKKTDAKGSANILQMFQQPKIKPPTHDVEKCDYSHCANLCGRRKTESVLQLIDEWVVSDDVPSDDDVAFLLRYFYKLIDERRWQKIERVANGFLQ